MDTYELYHYGVKGMKWGVRRYQNKDGSLTAKGKKRYDKMSDDKLYKTLNKQVKEKRGEIHGSSNRWRRDCHVGPNSEKVIRERQTADKKWRSSKEYANALKKAKDIDKKWSLVEQGKMTEKEWNKQHDKAYDYFEKHAMDYGYAKINNKYSKKYLDGFGKDMTVAHLKDLGYDNDTARQFTDRLLKSGRVLGGL